MTIKRWIREKGLISGGKEKREGKIELQYAGIDGQRESEQGGREGEKDVFGWTVSSGPMPIPVGWVDGWIGGWVDAPGVGAAVVGPHGQVSAESSVITEL